MNYTLQLMVNDYDLNKTERVGDWRVEGANYEISENYSVMRYVIVQRCANQP